MTTFGFCFRPSLRRSDCSGPLYLWVTDYRGKTRFTPTRYDVKHEEWDATSGALVLPGDDHERRSALMEFARSMERDLLLVEAIVWHLEARGRYSAGKIIREFRRMRIPAEDFFAPEKSPIFASELWVSG